MALDRDATIWRLAIENTSDLIDTVATIRRQVRAVELKVYAGQIDCDSSVGLAGFNIPLFQFFDQSLILGDIGSLLVESFLLFGLFSFLAL
jgi:hypothetical protein